MSDADISEVRNAIRPVGGLADAALSRIVQRLYALDTILVTLGLHPDTELTTALSEIAAFRKEARESANLAATVAMLRDTLDRIAELLKRA